MKKIIFFSFLFFTITFLKAQSYNDSKLPINKRVDLLISEMNIDEKIGQMSLIDLFALKDNYDDLVKYHIGSVLNGGNTNPGENKAEDWQKVCDSIQRIALSDRLSIPILYGTDAIHGHNNVVGATIFPHNIGLGCTNDSLLVYKIGKATAKEVKATGINWTYSPCLAVPQNEFWGRYYEGFSENPQIVSVLGAALVVGLQGDSLSHPESVLACAKHFVGDGGTENGVDRGNTITTTDELEKKYVYPYKQSIDNNVGSVMASFSSINKKQCHGEKDLLTDKLRNELNFKGILVSDWEAIDLLPGDYYSDVVTSINAGIDLVMIPNNYEKFANTLREAIEKGDISMERINEAVGRILTKKFEMGLFENPYAITEYLKYVGCDEHRQLAREAVRKSVVVLKNNTSLPIKSSTKKIVVAGKHAQNIGLQCGGWSIFWQGESGEITKGTTIYDAIKTEYSHSAVSYSETGDIEDNTADVAIAVIGEKPYAEWFGDRKNLNLDQSDIDVITNLYNKNIPVVCILISGRPLILDPIIEKCDAIVAAWLPGTEGQGIADIISGQYEATGTLSYAWPRSISDIPLAYNDSLSDPLFDYGYGINLHKKTTLLPKLLSATLDTSNKALILNYNTNIEGNIKVSDFSVLINGKFPLGITSISKLGIKDTRLKVSLSKELEYDQWLTISYTGKSIKNETADIAPTFKNYPVFVEGHYANFAGKAPGFVQTENYYNQLNIEVKECWDDIGSLSTVIQPGEFIDLKVDVLYSGFYHLNVRYKAQTNVKFKLFANNVLLLEDELKPSKKDNWNGEVFKKIQLLQNVTKVRFMVTEGEVETNWISFDLFRKIEKKKAE